MSSHYICTTLTVILYAAPFTLGLPQVTDATSQNPTVFTPWSSHADCAAPATACKSDCTQAVKNLCEKDLTTENIIETVGECTAWYLYQIGNTLPTFDQCYSAFAYINDAGKPGPEGCGGTFGGALGWDKNGDRTHDPAFAIYPKSGNGNCMRTETPESPPLAQHMLPDGTEIPIDQCPAAVGRRQLEGGHGLKPIPRCFVENGAFQLGCNVVCISWIASLTWWSAGVGAAIGLLPCLGVCDAVGWKLLKTCEKENPIGAKLKARQILDAPLSPQCRGTQTVAFECPIVRKMLLDFHQCSKSEGVDVATVEVGGDGSGVKA